MARVKAAQRRTGERAALTRAIAPAEFPVGASDGSRDQLFAWSGSGAEVVGVSGRINATTPSTIRVRASGVSRPTSPVIRSLLAVNRFLDA